MKRLILMLLPLLLWGIPGCVPHLGVDSESPCDYEFSYDFKGNHFNYRGEYNKRYNSLRWDWAGFTFSNVSGDDFSHLHPGFYDIPHVSLILDSFPFVEDSVYTFSECSYRHRCAMYITEKGGRNRGDIKDASFTFTSSQDSSIVFNLLLEGQTWEGDSLLNFNLIFYKTGVDKSKPGDIKSLIIPRK